MYALGWTQHSTGVQIIRAAAMLQLLLGNVGRPGGGVNALRGHSNIQGATDMAGTFDILPGYLKAPNGALTDLATYLDKSTPWTLNKEAWASMNYWTTTPSSWSRSSRRVGEGRDQGERLRLRLAAQGRRQLLLGLHVRRHVPGPLHAPRSQGAGARGLHLLRDEPGGTGPNSEKMVAALAKLKWLVMVENQETETAIFWKAPPQLQGPPVVADPDRGLSCFRRRISPRRTARSPTPPAGSSGNGRRSIPPARPRATRRSSPGCSSRSATSTRRRAARCRSR